MIRSLPPWLRFVIAAAVIAAIAYPVVSRDSTNKPAAKARGSSKWPPDSITIAVPWAVSHKNSLIEGVILGHEQVNASGGPLAGKIRVKFVDEPDDVRSDGSVARAIASDPEVVAVIGHESSDQALQAAITYEVKGILHLSPKATLPRLTKHRFQYTFRLVPDDEGVAAALVEYARRQGWKHLGILYSRIEESESLARSFSLRANGEGLSPSYFRSYLPEHDYLANDFRPMLASTTEYAADAILLAERLPWAGKMLLDMQALGMKQPVLAGDNLDSSVTWKIGGEAAQRVHFASFVDPGSKDPAFVAFLESYRKRFGTDPGYGAAQGYEAFMLFVKAVEQSRSSAPIVVATTIRTNTWQGLFGKVSFTPEGDVVGRKLFIKRIQNGRFITVTEVNP